MTSKIESSRHRPLGIWLICGFYLLSVGWTIFAFVLVFGEEIPLTASQKAYFESLSLFDWLFSLAIGATGISAAVCLFLLRRLAISLFTIHLGLSIGSTAFAIWRTNFAEAVGGAGLVGAVVGLLIPIAIIVYAQKLAKRGVLC